MVTQLTNTPALPGYDPIFSASQMAVKEQTANMEQLEAELHKVREQHQRDLDK